MKMTEYQWEKKLKINTCGRKEVHSDQYNYPYEPTPYSVLERLAESRYIDKTNRVIDYGCGKGRVGFCLNSLIGCEVTGVEFDEQICQCALKNKESYNRHSKIEFVCQNAEEFVVKDADSFYFFNPFSAEVLRSVLGRILDSYYEEQRDMKLFFYYPNDEYLAELMTAEELLFVDEIDCQDLFEGKNNRERILIFEVY